ncbi:MAG: universal stress protein [Gammaproteobacteria bacterium]|nr:universal stress protein [Gammaproteobacteria bacterium]
MKKILVTIDFSDTAKEALNQAITLAHDTNTEIYLLYVAPANPDYIGLKTINQREREELSEILHKEHAQLHEMAHALTKRGVKSKALIMQGDIVDSILHEADKINVDLIVMGSHGYSGLTRALLGSISEGVLKKTTCPILIVPHRE